MYKNNEYYLIFIHSNSYIKNLLNLKPMSCESASELKSLIAKIYAFMLHV